MPELTDLEKRMRQEYIILYREANEPTFTVSTATCGFIVRCLSIDDAICTADCAARVLAKIVKEETAGIQQQSQEMRTAAEEYEKLYSETLTRLGRSEQLRQRDAEIVEAAKELAEKIGVAKLSYRRPHITSEMHALAAKMGEKG